MALKDNNLVFREGAAAITTVASTRSTALRVKQGMRNCPMVVEIRYYDAYTATGTGPLLFTLQKSTDNATFSNLSSSLPGITMGVLIANKVSGLIRIPVVLYEEYVAVESSITTATGPNYNYDAFLVLVRP